MVSRSSSQPDIKAALSGPPDWSDAPPDWNWAAQDADGRWFWYRTEPLPGPGGGVWRSNSRDQCLAGVGQPNPDWDLSLIRRPGS